MRDIDKARVMKGYLGSFGPTQIAVQKALRKTGKLNQEEIKGIMCIMCDEMTKLPKYDEYMGAFIANKERIR